MFEVSLGIAPETPNITRVKWTGGVALAVEHLPCECKVLSSNSSPTKKKKKGRACVCLIFS
jgi:hypothetical protein